MIDLDSFGWLQSSISATLMLAMLGAIAFVVLSVLPLRSWRLRSWLVGAVLLQGLMVVRAPIHLGLIESNAPVVVAAHETGFHLDAVEIADEPIERTTGGVASSPTLAASRAREQPEFERTIWELNEVETIFAIWLAVAVAMICVAAARYGRVARLVRGLHRAPLAWQREWSLLCRSRGSSRRNPGPSVRRCELLVSDSVGPLVIRRLTGYSLIVPRAYWSALTTTQRRGVMLHELAHLQRADVWRQTAARIIATLHWFNPLAWWALRQYEHASECACDDRVARDGKQTAAGFASALVQLIQWHAEGLSSGSVKPNIVRGIGFQTMAAPPLKERVSRLLNPHPQGDSIMKRIAIVLLAVTLIGISFFQIRLTTAQDSARDGNRQADAALRVIDDRFGEQLADVAARLDSNDETTERFRSLLDTPSGKLAVAGYLDALGDRSRQQAQHEAIPRFVEAHFVRNDKGELVVGPNSLANVDRWTRKSQRLSVDMENMQAAMSDIANRLDTSSEAGGLFKRLLQDPQAPIAVLINELQGRGTIERFLDRTFQYILVDRGDGKHIVVESQRPEIETQIARFERAGEISQRLKRELIAIAAEYSPKDEAHEKLIRYLHNPITATIVAMEVSEDVASVRQAIEGVHRHFEENSMDTVDGLVILNDEVWQKMNEIFARVDRADNIMPRVSEKLVEFADALSTDDELTARLAEQMKNEAVATYFSAEMPNANADAGEELRALLSEVMTESDGKLSIQESRQEDLTQKSRELLKLCRRIRRHAAEVGGLLDEVADHGWVDQLGVAGRYTLLDEIRRFAESHRPDVVMLLHEDLMVENENGRIQVREDRREIIRQLIEQSERVRAEEANNDF